jgi:4-hydroxybutyrate CoA-transferase
VTTAPPPELTPAAVRAQFRAGDQVFVAGGCGQPDALLEVVAAAGLELPLTVFDCSVPGMTELDADRISSAARLNTGFFMNGYRRLHEAGRLDWVPAFHSARYRALDDDYGIDVALIMVAPPGADGACSLGLHADYSLAMLHRARLVIAEINTAVPDIADAPRLPLADIDFAVSSNRPLLEYRIGGNASETEDRIAAHIAGLIEDGDCLQLGIGSLPVSILRQLGAKRDLGVHTGLLTEAFMPLVEAGVVNGRRKNIDTGKLVTGIAAGSAAFYRWCADYKGLALRPVRYTHDAAVLASLERLVAINTTLEIDLFGQLNSETLNGRQIGGGGGLVDFLRGARASKGGRSIIALSATAKGGSLSKIQPLLQGPVTALRADVDYVVTEYGVARLSNQSLERRAEALIGIAHPDFRAELTAQWQELLRRC